MPDSNETQGGIKGKENALKQVSLGPKGKVRNRRRSVEFVYYAKQKADAARIAACR